MKTMCLALILAVIVGAASPAVADIVEVTTSVTMPAPITDEDLEDAVGAAARGVLRELDLQPVMMIITGAYVNAGRLYVRFLVADEAGARVLGLGAGNPEAQMPETNDNVRGLRI